MDSHKSAKNIVQEFFQVLDEETAQDPELAFKIKRFHVCGDYAKKSLCLARLNDLYPDEVFSIWIKRQDREYSRVPLLMK